MQYTQYHGLTVANQGFILQRNFFWREGGDMQNFKAEKSIISSALNLIKGKCLGEEAKEFGGKLPPVPPPTG